MADQQAPTTTSSRWSAGALLGAAMGLLPHLLHHAGLLAGAALLAGLGGTVLFAALGLAAMTPMLLRLRRRFGSWWAPAVAVLLFAAMFAVSTLLIGPAIRGTTEQHTVHHSGQATP